MYAKKGADREGVNVTLVFQKPSVCRARPPQSSSTAVSTLKPVAADQRQQALRDAARLCVPVACAHHAAPAGPPLPEVCAAGHRRGAGHRRLLPQQADTPQELRRQLRTVPTPGKHTASLFRLLPGPPLTTLSADLCMASQKPHHPILGSDVGLAPTLPGMRGGIGGEEVSCCVVGPCQLKGIHRVLAVRN